LLWVIYVYIFKNPVKIAVYLHFYICNECVEFDNDDKLFISVKDSEAQRKIIKIDFGKKLCTAKYSDKFFIRLKE